MPRSAEPTTRIELFDGPRVRAGGAVVDHFPTQNAAALLALLALRPDRRRARAELAELLWPEDDEEIARRNLRECLYSLRRALPDGQRLIQADRAAVWLDNAGLFVDACAFDRALREARDAGIASDPERRLAALERAAELYVGLLAPGLYVDEVIEARRRCERAAFDAFRALAGLLADRDPARAIEHAARTVAVEPLDEPAQEELIRLYARAGRPGAARRQYRALCDTLREDHGGKPSAAIAEFVRALADDARAARAERPARKPRPTPRPVPPLDADDPAPCPTPASPPSPHAARAVPALAAALVLLLLVCGFLGVWLWRGAAAHTAPLTVEDRLRILVSLRGGTPQAETPAEQTARHRKQGEQCLALGEAAWAAWYGPDEQAWVERLRAIEPDLRASMAWLLENDPASAVQLGGALTRFWFMNQELPEASRYLGQALDRAPAPRSSAAVRWRARALVGRSLTLLSDDKKRDAEGLVFAREAERLYASIGDRWGEAHALRHEGLLLNGQVRQPEARRACRRALALFEQVPDERGEAVTLFCLSLMGEDGSPEHSDLVSSGYALRALRMFRKHGNEWGVGAAFSTLALCAFRLTPNARTMPCLTKYEQECRAQIAWDQSRGQLSAAADDWRKLLRMAARIGDKRTLGDGLLALVGDLDPNDNLTRAALVKAYLRYADKARTTPTGRAAAQRTLATLIADEHGARHAAGLPDAPIPDLTLDQAVKLALR